MRDVKLSIQDVDKIYGHHSKAVHAVKNLSMDVHAGEIVALLGSSGCGKTSILRMIAGFEDISRGSISLAGRVLNRLPPVKRQVAMAFEGYSLYPPLNIRDNMAFALKASKLSAPEIAKKVGEIAEMLEIGDILERFPSSISGGQQQRASLGRALIRDAELHLLDEPMGQLEPQLRTLLRGRIKHFIKSKGLTAILVTHDQAEANALADRIAVMEDGTLQQFDSHTAIKNQPANLFSGTFVGEPPMNVFNANIVCRDGTLSFELVGSDVCLKYPQVRFSSAVLNALQGRQQVVLGIRPYAVKRQAEGVSATVAVNQWLGDQSHIAADFAGQSIILVEHDRALDKPGDRLSLHIDPSSLHLFDPVSGMAISHGDSLA
ncbi:MAG: multiple sugar transport system ATP-binding protein [Granulosicoccus sp.]|jgi:multiple sugar transport system ATP-binding protein